MMMESHTVAEAEQQAPTITTEPLPFQPITFSMADLMSENHGDEEDANAHENEMEWLDGEQDDQSSRKAKKRRRRRKRSSNNKANPNKKQKVLVAADNDHSSMTMEQSTLGSYSASISNSSNNNYGGDWNARTAGGDLQTTNESAIHDDNDDDDYEDLSQHYNSSQSRALPIGNVSHEQIIQLSKLTWESKAPESAEEYLLRVRLEANKCKQTVIAHEINQASYEHKRTIHRRLKQQSDHIEHMIQLSKQCKLENELLHRDSSCSLLSSRLWGDKCIERFQYMRHQVEMHLTRKEQLDHAHEYHLEQSVTSQFPRGGKAWDQWKQLCFGIKIKSVEVPDQSYWDEAQCWTPNLKLILSFDYVTVNSLLHEMFQWVLEDNYCSELRFQWLYHMMLRIDKPATAKLCADMNELLTWILQFRVSPTKDLKLVPHMNQFAILIVHYFGQGHPDIALYCETNKSTSGPIPANTTAKGQKIAYPRTFLLARKLCAVSPESANFPPSCLANNLESE